MSVGSHIRAACPRQLRPLLYRIEASPLGYRLAWGAVWSVAGTVVSRGLTFLASLFVARMLGKVGFGELGVIQSTIGMLGTFAGFGLGMTATKHVAEFRQIDPGRAGRLISLMELVALGTGGSVALGLVVGAGWLARHTLAAPQLAETLVYSAPLMLVLALSGAQTGALAGFEAFKTIAWLNLLSGVASFPLLIAGAYFGGLNGAVMGIVAAGVAGWIANHIGLRREAAKFSIPLRIGGCQREWRVLWRYSLPAVMSGIMVGPVNWVCSAMLVNQPGGYSEMGVFSAANQWFTLILLLPTVLGQVMFPMGAERLSRDDGRSAARLMLMSIKLNGLIVLPVLVIGSLSSPLVMRAYGRGFESGWPTLVVVFVTGGLLAIQGPAGQIINASGKIWLGFWMNLGWGLAFMAFSAALLRFGGLGLATARLLAYVVHGTWTIWYARYVLKSYGGASLHA